MFSIKCAFWTDPYILLLWLVISHNISPLWLVETTIFGTSSSGPQKSSSKSVACRPGRDRSKLSCTKDLQSAPAKLVVSRSMPINCPCNKSCMYIIYKLCVYMHIMCVYVYIKLHIYIYIYVYTLYIYIYIHYIYIHYIYTLYIYTLYIYIIYIHYIYIHQYIYIYMSVYMTVYVCLYVYVYIYVCTHASAAHKPTPLYFNSATVYSPHRDLAVVAQRLRVRRSPGSWSATKRHLPCARQGASTKHKLTGWNFHAVKKAHLIELCLRLFWRQCKNWCMQQVHFWEKVQVLPAEPNALVQLR